MVVDEADDCRPQTAAQFELPQPLQSLPQTRRLTISLGEPHQPRMFQSLCSGHPFLRISVEQGSDELFGICWELPKPHARHIGHAFLHDFDGFLRAVGLKRHIPRQHHKGNGSHAPHIAADAIAAVQYLWSHVFGRPANPLRLLIPHQRGQSPVDKFHPIPASRGPSNKDILRFEVAVCHFLMVRVVQSLEYLRQDIGCVLLSESVVSKSDKMYSRITSKSSLPSKI